MNSIIDFGNQLFGNANPTLAEEVLFSLLIKYKIKKEQMPLFPQMVLLLDLVRENDEIRVSFEGEETEQSYIFFNKSYEEQSYSNFIKTLGIDEEIKVSIKITKSVCNSSLSVYSLDLFSKFLQRLSIEDHLVNFNDLFKRCGEHITFRLADTNGYLYTPTIAFSSMDVSWNIKKKRESMLKDCMDSSIFLQREQYAVLPQDFSVNNYSEELERINEIFRKLRAVLSFVYLANTASIFEDKAVLQFNPKESGEKYSLDELQNEVVVNIYEWVHRDINCVDKAGIARGIINLYCRSKDDILGIKEPVFNSIKNDYVIYQNRHIESYFELKNKISEFILDASKQIQDLSKDLTDGLKNNFIAVIGFALTVLLTDSISLEEWTKADVSPRIIGICYLFVCASALFLVITIAVSEKKWEWIENTYKDLKDNYKGILDEKDIEASFKDNRYFNSAKQNYESMKAVVVSIWSVTIIVMLVFTMYIAEPLKNSPSTSQPAGVTQDIMDPVDYTQIEQL